MIRLSIVLSSLACLLWLPTAGAVPVLVTADDVNLRAGPSLAHEVVIQVARGEILEARGRLDGEWVEVVPPDRVDLWVYGELIRDGVVVASRLQVRAGPGISYKPVGQVEEGDAVTVRGVMGDWTKIDPPPGCSLWVSSDFIEGAGSGAGSGASAGVREAANTAAADSGLRPTPARSAPDPERTVLPSGPAPRRQPPRVPVQPDREALERRRDSAPVGRQVTLKGQLVGSREQGRAVSYRGIVRPAGGAVWLRPSRFRLVQQDAAQRPVTRCYLVADEDTLSGLEGRAVQVLGNEFWVQGVRHPVVVVSGFGAPTDSNRL